MDSETVRIYDEHAAELAVRQGNHSHPYLSRLIQEFFLPGQPTADIGCGCGRDLEWMVDRGYPAVGYDASEGMLAQARSIRGGMDLRRDTLPDLGTIESESYDNVVCSAVLMHLPREQLGPSIRSLARILRPDGRLILAYRETRDETLREADGRLFSLIERLSLVSLLGEDGLEILLYEERPGPADANVTWHYVVSEKNPL